MEARKTLILSGMMLGLSALAHSPRVLATEVYSATETEDDAGAANTGLLSVTPSHQAKSKAEAKVSRKSKKNSKRVQSLPRQVKSTPRVIDQPPPHPSTAVAGGSGGSAPAVVERQPVHTIGTPRATFPGMEIPVSSRPARARSVTPQVSEKGAYDPVPSDQTEALIRRLRIVEAIITRHGRAYDYRVHTVKELEAVLAQLDGNSRQSSNPQPRPAEKSPAAQGAVEGGQAVGNFPPPPPAAEPVKPEAAQAQQPQQPETEVPQRHQPGVAAPLESAPERESMPEMDIAPSSPDAPNAPESDGDTGFATDTGV